MKTTKLTIGIVSIILAVLIFMQSAIAGLGNALAGEGETSGSFGALLAICYLVAGIMGIIGRKGGKVGYVSTGFYIVGGILGLIFAGTYSDLRIWGGLAVIFGIVFWIGTYSGSKKELDDDSDIIPRTKKRPDFLERDYSFGWYLLTAFIFVGLIDLFLNFSGMGVLNKLTGNANQNETALIQQSNQDTSSVDVPENASDDSDDLFVKSANDAKFENGILKGNSYSIKIIYHSVFDNDGSKYILFKYYTILNKDYSEDDPISPSFAWSMNFNVVQDNDPNKVNKLSDIFTPDKYIDESMVQIKPGGTVRSQIGYKLSDDNTPVKLIAEDIIGTKFGEEEYKIK